VRVGPWLGLLPLAEAGLVLLVVLSAGPLFGATERWPLWARAAAVLALVAPPSTLAGVFFPVGVRLARAHAPDAIAWLWGVNGAAGVFASSAAVATSMWLGVRASLALGAIAYATAAVPFTALLNALPRLPPSQRHP
jgi:hypothetical protein